MITGGADDLFHHPLHLYAWITTPFKSRVSSVENSHGFNDFLSHFSSALDRQLIDKIKFDKFRSDCLNLGIDTMIIDLVADGILYPASCSDDMFVGPDTMENNWDDSFATALYPLSHFLSPYQDNTIYPIFVTLLALDYSSSMICNSIHTHFYSYTPKGAIKSHSLKFWAVDFNKLIIFLAKKGFKDFFSSHEYAKLLNLDDVLRGLYVIDKIINFNNYCKNGAVDLYCPYTDFTYLKGVRLTLDSKNRKISLSAPSYSGLDINNGLTDTCLDREPVHNIDLSRNITISESITIPSAQQLSV